MLFQTQEKVILLTSSFWGVGGGLSKSRKSRGLSLSVSTRGGVFSARGLKGVGWIRSRSAGLENEMSSLFPRGKKRWGCLFNVFMPRQICITTYLTAVVSFWYLVFNNYLTPRCRNYCVCVCVSKNKQKNSSNLSLSIQPSQHRKFQIGKNIWIYDSNDRCPL